MNTSYIPVLRTIACDPGGPLDQTRGRGYLSTTSHGFSRAAPPTHLPTHINYGSHVCTLVPPSKGEDR